VVPKSAGGEPAAAATSAVRHGLDGWARWLLGLQRLLRLLRLQRLLRLLWLQLLKRQATTACTSACQP